MKVCNVSEMMLVGSEGEILMTATRKTDRATAKMELAHHKHESGLSAYFSVLFVRANESAS